MNREDLILKLGLDPVLAHQSLFRHRHAFETPPFHSDMIRAWRSRHPRVNTMAFRAAGKSTIAEEALTLMAEYELFHNCIIVGSTEKRAIERLASIKHELSINEDLIELFGEVDEHTCQTWNESEVIMPNGVRFAALGRGQSLRGTKYLQWRPDFCFLDDVEETEEGRPYERDAAEETVRWVYTVLIPALDRDARVRVNATPLAPFALPMVLKNDPEWLTQIYPIEHTGAGGERRATWPGFYDLDWIDAKRASLDRLGLHHEYMQEYMCEPEDPKAKIFTADMFVVKPRVHAWEPTFAMFDPARTTKSTSATTGWSVWSWLSNRMVVWDGGGSRWKPDEIVNKIFEVHDTYAPVAIGVEQDGLEEFLLQPIRHAQLLRGSFLPLRGVRAPKGKISFIEAMQPYFLAKEVTLAKDLPEFVRQFLSFPAGEIDAPNALAYAKHPGLYPGQVVYENFTSSCVVETMAIRPRAPCYLCLNAGGGVVTAVLAQIADGALHVLADYVREGDAGSVLRDILVVAAVDAGMAPRLMAPPAHFGDYAHSGLRGAVAKIPSELRPGGAPDMGRDEIRALLQRTVRDRPAILVAQGARWTLNAFAAGYAFEVDKQGRLGEQPRAGVYATLMQGLESFAGLMRVGVVEVPPNVRVTEGGQRYVSALPNRQSIAPAKDALLRADDRVSDLPQFMLRR